MVLVLLTLWSIIIGMFIVPGNFHSPHAQHRSALRCPPVENPALHTGKDVNLLEFRGGVPVRKDLRIGLSKEPGPIRAEGSAGTCLSTCR